jgi:hypothetical protein
MPSSLRALRAASAWDLDEHVNGCDDPSCSLSAADELVRCLERRGLTSEGLTQALHVVGLEYLLRLAGPVQQKALALMTVELAQKLLLLSEDVEGTLIQLTLKQD